MANPAYYTTQNLLRITFSFNDLMLKTNRLKKDFFYKDRLIFRLDDPVPIFFLSLSEKNLQEFLYVCTVQEASIH